MKNLNIILKKLIKLEGIGVSYGLNITTIKKIINSKDFDVVSMNNEPKFWLHIHNTTALIYAVKKLIDGNVDFWLSNFNQKNKIDIRICFGNNGGYWGDDTDDIIKIINEIITKSKKNQTCDRNEIICSGNCNDLENCDIEDEIKTCPLAGRREAFYPSTECTCGECDNLRYLYEKLREVWIY